MPDIHYTINPVDVKPDTKRGKQKGSSKYASIIEAFLESEYDLVRVDDTGKDAYYLCGQLKKVCYNRGIDSVNVSVRNKEVYLEQ